MTSDCVASGIIYLRMPFSQQSIMNRTGLLFFQAMNGAFGSAINTSTAIPTQLQVVSRERTAGMYSIFPFCESLRQRLALYVHRLQVFCSSSTFVACFGLKSMLAQMPPPSSR